MKDKKATPAPLQAEEYIKKMIKKKRTLTGVELGNCLLCRIGYDIPDPTDEFITNTLNQWKSQADFDAYNLRLEIRRFLMLLHNSAVYALAKGEAESLNVVQVIMQITKQQLHKNQYYILKELARQTVENEFYKFSIKGINAPLEERINTYYDESRLELKDNIEQLINKLSDNLITAFTDSITFVLNCGAVVDLFAEVLNLDLHTYKVKMEETARRWLGVDMLKNTTEIIKNAYEENVISKTTYQKAINTIKKATTIDTKEATEDEINEVKEAVKKMKSEDDFIRLREWIIQKTIKTQAFI